MHYHPRPAIAYRKDMQHNEYTLTALPRQPPPGADRGRKKRVFVGLLFVRTDGLLIESGWFRAHS